MTEAVLDGVVTGRNVGPGLCLAVQRDEPDHVVVVANLGPELYFDPQGRIRVAFRPRWRWLDVCLIVAVVAVTLFVGWALGEWADRPIEVAAWLASLVVVWLAAWWISYRISWMYDPNHPA